MHANFTEAIRRNVADRSSSTAVIFLTDFDAHDGRISVTYAELDRRARSVAAALLERCAPGDRALLLYPEGLDFVTAFVGCLYAGVVAVPSPLPGRYRHHRRRVSAIAADARVAAVLTDSRSLAEVGDWAEASQRNRDTLLVTDALEVPPLAEESLPRLDRDSIALLQYTSGSTGSPKGVVLTQGNLLHNAASLCRTFALDDGSRFGSWIPHYHDMGLMGILLPPLYLGSSCVLMSPTTFLKRPHWWLRMIDEFDITWSAGPNFAYELCSRRITDEQLAGLDLSRWKYANNGSEPVQAATLTAFAKRFAAAGLRTEALNPSYGMAEATVFVSGSGHREPVVLRVDEQRLSAGALVPVSAADPGRDVVSCGFPHDYDVRIVEPESRRALPEGEIGEIWLRGPSVGQGYWDNPEATERTFHATVADAAPDTENGYLRTGDLGAVLDGELFITGRLKEMLILRGRNLYPQDIEYEARQRHPELHGTFGAAFTVPVRDDEGHEEELLVLVHELRGRHTENELEALASSIRRTVFTEFGAHLSGLVLVRRGAVQRTTSGKVQRLQMREHFRDGEISALIAKLDPRLERTTA
ncbi:fatty acyl-AMP ligase [Streptomyces sp. V4I2]|uniref:fatty acyl-AMP ligase n=1 Tax=Streptomyces sp. V4I2 TaxID=3042280 RepID=UPI0027897142|nr:fatty acyl-AMP ligase [Streptomyces sp. V4I2]MDQ1044997.1 acyl-CoA synthetase (AMP-forming)/AMP-acid ligase II [Streptomyces sp. V4I2]